MSQQVLYGWENETMEAKIKHFLKFSPAERILQMLELIEFTQQIAPKQVRLDAPNPSRRIQIIKRSRG